MKRIEKIQKKMEEIGFEANPSLAKEFMEDFPAIIWFLPNSLCFYFINKYFTPNMAFALKDPTAILKLLDIGFKKNAAYILCERFWKLTQGNLNEDLEKKVAKLLIDGKISYRNLDVYFGRRPYEHIPDYNMNLYLTEKTSFLHTRVEEFFLANANKALICKYH